MPPQPRTFVATAEQAGLTVLSALRQWLPGTSWSTARKLLAGRHVLVNQSLCLDEARRLKAGETVTLHGPTLRPPPSAGDVRLVWLDADVIVIDKPARMLTLRHASERNWSRSKKLRQPALDDLLLDLIAKREGSDVRRQGPVPRVYSVHRIDRDTSGLVVFARNPASSQNLIRQFKEHTVERTYLAVAEGQVAAATIKTFLVEDRGDGKRGSTQRPGEGKQAVTHVRPLEQLGVCTLIECRLETGRTHQIRIHLSEAGHPLWGDLKYGPLDAGPQKAVSPTRLALHAATLGFHHPSKNNVLRFESPLPADFSSLLDGLRRLSRRK